MSKETQKSKFDRPRKFGDRKDGWRVRNIDPYMNIVPVLMPGRNASCIYFSETVDATKLVEFVKRLNEDEQAKQEKGIKKYTYFGVFMAALVRTLAMRPHLNRFISSGKIYQRRNIKLCFVAKKDMTEEAPETDVLAVFKRDANLDDVMRKLQGGIRAAKEGEDETTDVLNVLFKLPTFILRGFKGLMDLLLKFDLFPKSLEKVDPMQASAFVSNLGSINLVNVPFHHLYERGTCSLFVVMGKIYPEGDRFKMNFTVTLDERVSNGFYYIRSIEFFKELLNNPEVLLESPSEDEIPLDI